MSYEEEIIARIEEKLSDVNELGYLDLHPQIIHWMAMAAFDAIDDELLGPE
jgi:hypothetical protein